MFDFNKKDIKFTKAQLPFLVLCFAPFFLHDLDLTDLFKPQKDTPNISPVIAQALIDGKAIKLEVANSPAAQAAGLTHRADIDIDRGMLYQTSMSQPLTFTGEGMEFSTDLIFMLGTKVVGFYAGIKPCTTATTCLKYTLNSKYTRVLEVKAGVIDKLSIKNGTEVDISFLKKMKINWVGGNLPKVGKSWMARGLAESIFNKHRTPSIVVDTSINSKLSQIYNPKLLNLYDPSLYFKKNELDTDDIYKLAENCKNLVVKLSSASQTEFLNWLIDTDIFDSEIEQHFWFVTNGRRDSIKYFNEIYEVFKPFIGNDSKHRLSIVKNWYNLKWQDCEEIKNVHSCNLSGIITNPTEIHYIEDNGLILSEVARLDNLKAPLLFRSRLMRFLKECDLNFLSGNSIKLEQEETELESIDIKPFHENDDDNTNEIPI